MGIYIEVSPAFKLYEGGVYEMKAPCGFFPNHALIIYGYDFTDKDNRYLMVRNSWGTDWGDNGYMKFKLSEYDDQG